MRSIANACPRQHRSRGFSTALAALAALSLVGCGQTGRPGAVSLRDSSTAQPAAVASGSPVVADGRLAAPVTYGLTRFDPAPASAMPKLTPQQATSLAMATNEAPSDGNYSSQTTAFCLYTDTGEGDLQKDGSVSPYHVQQPAWIVTYKDAIGVSSGGASIQGESPGPPVVVHQDRVIVIDDSTGAALLSLEGTPGPQAK